MIGSNPIIFGRSQILPSRPLFTVAYVINILTHISVKIDIPKSRRCWLETDAVRAYTGCTGQRASRCCTWRPIWPW